MGAHLVRFLYLPGSPTPTGIPTLRLATLLALVLPLNLALNVSPSPTVLNQAAAWIAFGAVLAAGASLAKRPPTGLAVLYVATLLLAGAAALSPLMHSASGIALSIIFSLAAALAIASFGASIGAHTLMPVVARAAVAAALIGAAIGCIQVFAPSLADSDWIAATSQPGRASGNLRQPNHLATLLLWGSIGALFLFASSTSERRALHATSFVAMQFGIVLTASRTGFVGVLSLALWGALDRGIGRAARALLIAAPLLYALFWTLLNAPPWFGAATPFRGAERLQQADPTSSRLAIWSNTIDLIRDHPFTGVGVGEFNFAWTLTAFAQRPREFFDHAHNLPLQLLAELGVPLGLLVLALLLWAFWRAFANGVAAPPDEAPARRCAFMMLLVVALHSLLEYPLWYAHLLFPAALVWGMCLGRGAWAVRPDALRQARARLAWRSAGIALIAGGILMMLDYRRVAVIFEPRDDSPLSARIEAGRGSWFFAHHADYALVTTASDPSRVLPAFERPLHYLLDARLMVAWARALAASGDVDRARWIAARLAEFQHRDSASFMLPCAASSGPATIAAGPFQCQPPKRSYDFTDFR